MKITPSPLKDLFIIEPTVFSDKRGYFFESYSKDFFAKNGIAADFVQDNQSKSEKNVLRGMHFQKPPFAQGKLVRVLQGAVLDAVIDIRKNSSTFGQHFTLELTEANKKMIYVPPGFAHGFITLENDTVFHYKVTAPYSKESEDGILFNDKTIGIVWPSVDFILSDKDKVQQSFVEYSKSPVF